MKLRNKKTGQIVELELVVRNDDYLNDVIVETFYNEEPTIKKLYEDWEDFEKAEKVNSNTQLYKQAGNSIVVNK